MKQIVLWSLFIWLASAHEYEVGKPDNLNCNCGWTNPESERIAYTWVVGIYVTKTQKFICAGTILTQRHVLTAADCVNDREASDIEVCKESSDRTKCLSEGTKKVVDNITIMKRYRPNKSTNNIALIRTLYNIGFDINTGPACFLQKEFLDEHFIGSQLIFLEWGLPKLRKIYFYAYSQDECRSLYVRIKEEMHICVKADSLQNGAEDAGGTFLQYNQQTGRYTVIGLIDSIASVITSPVSPTLTTNVSAFRWWIEREIQSDGAELCHQK